MSAEKPKPGRKRTVLRMAGIAVLAVLSVYWTVDFFFPSVFRGPWIAASTGAEFDRATVDCSGLQIEATAHEERFVALAAPGSIHSYKVSGPDFGTREVARFRLGTRKPIPSEQIICRDEVVCFYDGHVVGVSRDSGRTWRLRGGPYGRIYPGQKDEYERITEATLNDDGTGRMLIKQVSESGSVARTLTTADFGSTWQLQ